MKTITVALAGNPNCGKTTIFNALTGAHQHVGNYPGVTVEIKQGTVKYNDYTINIVDLPGTYSLSAFSPEELSARNFLIEDKPNVVVDVLDASNIERHLYLTTQLIELNCPLVLAFNMSDVAEQKGLKFDNEQLSRLLEAKIVPMVGNKGKGKKELLEAIIATAEQTTRKRIHKINYGDEIEHELKKIESAIINNNISLLQTYQSRWLAVKLLEHDDEITAKIENKQIQQTVKAASEHLTSIFRDRPEIVLADRRYGFISGACQETIQTTIESRHNYSDLIDAIVTNRILGLPIFLMLMYLTFMLTFKLGSYPMHWLEHLFTFAGNTLANIWPAHQAPWLKSLVIDGIISGVGGVLVFLPNILLLFLAIALLEDSGYMARAAFIMDRIMHKIGLHGKSFIPMLIGFGCSVPAIMATRILENKRSRLTTIMVIPLMSCGAKLTIYAMLIPAFFPVHWQGPVMWLIYIIGIILAVICIKLLRLTILKGETIPFVMELPPYRVPTIKSLSIHIWQRAWMYLQKAGTIILAASVILWFAMNYPKTNPMELENLSPQQAQHVILKNSIIGRLGHAIEPAIKPLGFDWKIGTALLGATAAKELFVSQMAIIYAVEHENETKSSLSQQLQADYTALNGFCIMLFCLIYAPCVATVAITKQQTQSWRWAMFQFAGLTILAYIITLLVYQFGRLF